MPKLKPEAAVLVVVMFFALSFGAAIGTNAGGTEDIVHYPTRAWTVPDADTQEAISNMIASVNTSLINDTLYTLQGFGSRYYQAAGNTQSSIWLHDQHNGLGRLEVEYDNFTHNTYGLSNVIYTLPGTDPLSDDIYYAFAHQDCTQSDQPAQLLTNSPGGDDDASGCASVLEMARVMSQYEFRDTIKFCFFNAEEVGLVGATKHATEQQTAGASIPAMICYDMVGYSSGTMTYDLRLWYDTASTAQKDWMIAANNRYGVGHKITSELKAVPPSDMRAFYQKGFPGVHNIEEEWSPYYHTTNDKVEFLNLTMMEKVSQLGIATLAEMAGLVMKPDPAVSELRVEPSQPVEGEEVTITVNISNPEIFHARDVEVNLFIDFISAGSNFTTVMAGQSVEESFTWTASSGLHNISVVLDPMDTITEKNESNNNGLVQVQVNDIPLADLQANRTTVLTSEPVTFDAGSSTDSYGGVAEYLFHFGDGNSSGWSGVSSVEHSYERDGTYTANLTVKDGHGVLSGLATEVIMVQNRPPEGSPSANRTTVYTFSSIQFVSNATDADGVVNVSWDFDDGEGSYELSPVHNYSGSGAYEVALVVADDDMDSVSFTIDITVLNRGPTAGINASALSGNVTTEFTFEGLGADLDGTVEGYYWDFGDGSVGTGQYADHSYEAPGTYIINLTVTDDEGAQGAASVEVEITDLPPTAEGKADSHEVFTSETVAFDARDSSDLEGALSYVWDFGDGSTSTEVSPRHSYHSPGVFSVELTVLDTAGQSDTVTLEDITVKNRLPSAGFSVDGSFFVGEEMFFDAEGLSSDIEGELESFAWDFGDGSGPGSGAKTTHSYSEAGDYLVNLTVTDADGGVAYSEQTITITFDGGPPLDDDVVDDDDDISDPGPNYTAYAVGLGIVILAIILIAVIVVVIVLFLRRKKGPAEEQAPVEQTPYADQGQLSQAAAPQPAPAAQPEYAQAGQTAPQYAAPVVQQPYSEAPVQPPMEAQAPQPDAAAQMQQQAPELEAAPEAQSLPPVETLEQAPELSEQPVEELVQLEEDPVQDGPGPETPEEEDPGLAWE